MATRELADGERIVFGFDWSAWLTKESATILSSAWDVPSGLTEVSNQFNDTVATVKLELNTGSIGDSFEITNTITTDAGSGLIAERSMTIALVATKRE